MQINFLTKIKELRDEALFYEIDEGNCLSFEQFYDPIQTYKQQLNFKQFQDLQFEKFIAVEIQKELKIFLIKQIEGNFTEKQLIHQSSLALDFFDKIQGKLISQSLQQKVPESNFSSLFDKKSKNPPDLLVRDIYGPDSSSIGLSQNLLASSFGKLAKSKIQDFDKDQILRSLVMAVAINTAQITGLLTRKFDIHNVLITINRLNSLAFNRYFSTILKYTNPKGRLYVQMQSKEDLN